MGSNNNNSNLHNAKAVKDDEFYTKLVDIKEELQYYVEYFKDKIIYCNCDDPRKSKFWEYFHINFSKLSLKSLRATFYNGCPSQNRLFQIPGTSEVFYAEYRGGQDEDLSCYDKTTLLGNGSFDSKECVEILKTSDIVVTNPPFSLFREYMQVLLKYDKDFIILGSYSALTYKMMFTAYMEKQLFLGQHVDNGYSYVKPDGSEQRVCSNWYTSFPIKRIIPKLQLTKHYIPEEYHKYDNFDAIHVESIRDIPIDYDGYMGVPLNFIDYVNNNGYAEFDIIKFRIGDDGKDLRLSSTYNEIGGGQNLWFRIIIQHHRN